MASDVESIYSALIECALAKRAAGRHSEGKYESTVRVLFIVNLVAPALWLLVAWLAPSWTWLPALVVGLGQFAMTGLLLRSAIPTLTYEVLVRSWSAQAKVDYEVAERLLGFDKVALEFVAKRLRS